MNRRSFFRGFTMNYNELQKNIEKFSPDVLIAGAGLGGLLTGALLSKRRKKVLIVERLSRIGGRFTAREIEGYEVPTGALHLIPHGKRGPLGKILRKDLKLRTPIRKLHYFSCWKWKGEQKERRHQIYQDIFRMLPEQNDRLTLLKLAKDIPLRNKLTRPLNEYLSTIRASPRLKGFFSAITGFSMGLENHQVTIGEVLEFFNSLFKYGRPGVPRGGLRFLIKEINNYIIKRGGLVLTGIKVVELDNSSGNNLKQVILKARGHNDDHLSVKPKVVISNMGPIYTIDKLTDIPKRIQIIKNRLQVVMGAKIVYSVKKTILGHSGVTFFPDNKWVKGCAEPTHLAPELAPKGRHLFIAYITFQEHGSNSHGYQLKKAREELLSCYPALDKIGEELSIQRYGEGWPVNWVRQGIYLQPKIPFVENLWMVGDGFKPPGLVMSEGIAATVKTVTNQIIKYLDKAF